jgi:hypothetical protein
MKRKQEKLKQLEKEASTKERKKLLIIETVLKRNKKKTLQEKSWKPQEKMENFARERTRQEKVK